MKTFTNFTQTYRISLFAILIALLSTPALAQTGPAGVGNADGSSGQPRNILWVDAQQLNLSDGQTVTSWPDVSGNGHDLSSVGNDPAYATAALNGKNVVSFENANNETLSFYSGFNGAVDGVVGTQYSFFWVAARTSDDNQQYVFGGGTGSNNQNLYSGWGYPGNVSTPALVANQWGNDCAADWGNYSTQTVGDYALVSSVLNSTDRYLFENGTQIATAGNTTQLSSQSSTRLAYRSGSDTDYGDVNIAEVIFFQTGLTETQRIIVENYLSTKYNLALTANDYYTPTTIYINDLVGIGTIDGADAHTATTGSGGALYLEAANASLATGGEFVMAAHDNAETSSTQLNVSETNRARWQRSWYIEKNNVDGIDIKIKFSTEEAGYGTPVNVDNYRLLYRSNDGSTTDFTELTPASVQIDANNHVVFTLNSADFANGYYTLGIPQYNEWYSFISGDWDNPDSWTLDPSGALPNNPNSLTPTTSPTASIDKVYILSGKNITVSSNNKTNALLKVDGRIEFGTSTGHSFGEIKGGGRIILEGDNFPAGDATHFVSADQGEGTVVFSGGTYEIASAYGFFNMEVNLASSSDVVTLTNDLTLNGSLLVETGVFQINDATNTSVLNVSVANDVDILTDGTIQTGTADVFSAQSSFPKYHQFEIQGDFTNEGTALFTNRTAADYVNDDVSGAVEVIFNNPTADQFLQCNGPVVFNQLTINKGANSTYILNVAATSTANFKLYGANDEEVTGAEGERDGNKALRLLAGTAKLGGNITIPVLASNNSYDIDADARLWLNGANVTMPNGSSNSWLAVYGKLQLDGNSVLNENTEYGTILRQSGSFVINNGTVNLSSLRTSTWDSSGDHVGAYIQRGGTVTINEESSNGDYASFHLPYESNVFQMEGGTLTVLDQQHNGDANLFAIIINSSAGNYNVTGGTVILDMSKNVEYAMTSRAPFWNFILRNSDSNAHTLTITDFNESSGDVPDVPALPLITYNDLTIESPATLDANGQNLEITGNFNINDGAAYVHGNGTLKFFGDNNGSQINIGNTSNEPGLTIYRLEVEKDQNYNDDIIDDVEIISSGRSNNSLTLKVLNDILLTRGELDVRKLNVQLEGNLEIVDGNILYNDNTPGYILMNNTTTAQTIKGSSTDEQDFGNLIFNNSNGITLLSNINAHNITLTAGVVDMDTYNLEITGAITGSSYGNTKMFNGAGNASDGGLTLPTTLDGSYTDALLHFFPIGAGGEYGPVEIYCNGTFGTPTSGTLTAKAINDYHPANNTQSKTIPYYWNVSHDGLDIVTTDLQYTFYYYGTANPNENKGAALDYETYTWDEYNKTDNNGQVVNLPSIEFPSTAPLYGDFTVGNRSVFNAPEIYYSRVVSQNYDIGGIPVWSDPDTWSLESHTGDPGNGNNAYPQDGDIAIIGYGGTGGGTGGNRHHVLYEAGDNYTLAKVIIDSSEEPGVWDSRFFIEDGATIDMGVLEGDGTLEIFVDPTTPSTISGDIGSFTNSYADGSRVLFHCEGGSNVELPYLADILPDVRIEGGGNRTVYFSTDLLILDDLIVDFDATLRVEHDITINDDLRLGLYRDGSIEFGDNAAHTIIVNDRLRLTSDNASKITVNNSTPAGLEHYLKVGGDIALEQGNTFDLFTDNSGGNNVILEFFGETGNEFTNTDGMPVDLYRIEMNKLAGNEMHVQTDFDLGGPTDGDTKAIELISGDLFLDAPGIDINLTTGGADFKVPSGTSFQIKQGIVRASGDNTGIWLDETFTVGYQGQALLEGGTNNYIEYSASGNAEIVVYQGTLHVGSQVRRALNTEEGILTFRQEHHNSDIVFGTKADLGGETSRGVFEMVNPDCYFKQVEEAEITIANAIENADVPAFYLNLDATEVSLATSTAVNFGGAHNAANQNIGIYSAVPLRNITLDNTAGNNPQLSMETIALSADTLLINTGTTFNANALDLILYGDFTNSGTFNALRNSTYFSGTVEQNITGETSFYRFYKTAANTVTVNSPLTIEKYLDIQDGTLADGGNTLTVYGNINNDGIHDWGDAGDGIYLNGSAEQQVTNSGTFGKITLENPEGAYVPTEALPILVDDAIELRSGIFDIGKNLLVLDEDAVFIESTAYSKANMIQTNMSFTDNGIKKTFPEITSTTVFTYPIGSQGKYTPVELTIDAINSGGSIRVKAADEIQSTITDDDDECDEFDDTQNVLQYYWVLDAENVTSFTGEALMTHAEGDALYNNTHGYDLSDYITACLLYGNDSWNKFDENTFDENACELTFDFAGTNDAGISGEYTAGIEQSAGCNGAIPNQIPVFISISDGNWNDETIWETVPAGDVVPAGGPQGAIVIIEHNVEIVNNFKRNYKTTINSTGVLAVNNTYGHRLGVVEGQGTLYLERGDLPAAVYDDFIAPTGGTFEFGGTSTNYDILNEIPMVNNLIFSGSGERRFPNINLQVNGDLTINGDAANLQVINEHNTRLYLKENIALVSGNFDAGTNEARVVFNGGVKQFISGDFTGDNAFFDVEISNPFNVELSSPVEFSNNIYFDTGKFFTSPANTLTFTAKSENIVYNASNSSYVEGPLHKIINAGESFTFPVGNSNRLGNVQVLNTSAIETWEAQYYNYNPGNDGYDPESFDNSLEYVSHLEYWRVKSPGDYTAKVQIRWDDQSNVSADASERQNLRIVEWDDINTEWFSVGSDIVDNGQNSGTITTDAVRELKERFYTIGTVNLLLAMWQGDDPTNPTLWNVGENWDTGIVPENNVDVTIPAVSNLPQVNIAAECQSLEIESGASVTVQPGFSLSVSGDLTNSAGVSGLLLQSDATGTGTLIHNTNDVQGTAERYIAESGRYFYVSPPVYDAPASVFGTDLSGADKLYRYTAGTSWARVTSSSYTLGSGGEGYAYKGTAAKTLQFAGKFNNGDYNLDVAPGTDGKNLLGNPFPSAVDIENITLTDIQGNGIYYKLGGEGGSGGQVYFYQQGVGSTNGASQFIAPMQSFWIIANSTASDVFIPNAARATSGGNFLKSELACPKIRLRVLRDAEGYFDEHLLLFNPNMTDGYDIMDANKMYGEGTPEIYTTINNSPMVINHYGNLKEDVMIPVGVRIGEAGEYTIEAGDLSTFPEGTQVYLIDQFAGESGKWTLLNAQPYYTFTAAGAYHGHDRFMLYIAPVTTGEEELPETPEATRIYSHDKNIVVDYYSQTGSPADIAVYDMLGKVVHYLPNTAQGTHHIDMSHMISGVYIVKVVSGQTSYTEKVFIE